MNKRERRINFAMRFVIAIIGVPIVLGIARLGTNALVIALSVTLGWILWDVWTMWWRHRVRMRELDEPLPRDRIWTAAETKLYLDGLIKRNVQ
jgi:hypothetical protein